MYKLTSALAALAFVACAGIARADSSGHIDINSLSEQLPRSYDPLSPVSYDSYPSGSTACAIARGGVRFGCAAPAWRAQVRSPRDLR
jgi:hypothetical protein